MSLIITQAKSADAPAISGLTMRSKAHWGYDAAFMLQAKDELTYQADDIKQHPTFKATQGKATLGFYQLIHVDEKTVELDALFVEPEFMGQGIGGHLFSHAVKQARQRGYTTLTLQSDPFAEVFYLNMGCIKVGETPSLSIPGRVLPSMIFEIR